MPDHECRRSAWNKPSDHSLGKLFSQPWFLVFSGAESRSRKLSFYDLQTVLTTTNGDPEYFAALKAENDALGPNYRYESGTSMSAAAVSGVLALMQEFFDRNNLTYSPALMKALLINGARSAGPLYTFSGRADWSTNRAGEL